MEQPNILVQMWNSIVNAISQFFAYINITNIAPDTLIQMFKSMISGMSASVVYLALGYVLDYKFNPKKANIIALILSASLNFILQSRVFLSKDISKIFLFKYLLGEILFLGTNQLLVSLLIHYKKDLIDYVPKDLKKHYNTIVRLCVESLIFLCMAFPLRKYWIFI
jgi:putative flippase GtrA